MFSSEHIVGEFIVTSPYEFGLDLKLQLWTLGGTGGVAIPSSVVRSRYAPGEVHICRRASAERPQNTLSGERIPVFRTLKPQTRNFGLPSDSEPLNLKPYIYIYIYVYVYTYAYVYVYAYIYIYIHALTDFLYSHGVRWSGASSWTSRRHRRTAPAYIYIYIYIHICMYVHISIHNVYNISILLACLPALVTSQASSVWNNMKPTTW